MDIVKSLPKKKMEVDREHGLHLLHEMIRIRRFEEKSAQLYSAGKIRGFLHLYDGEEAVAVGVIGALQQEDAIVATYREHGQAIAKGMDMGPIMAEMYGKQEGCARGRGGSMHLFDKETRFYGGNAIVAGGLPLAVGLALADKMQGKNVISCCFFGDGAVQEGEFHESMTLAQLWKLPVLFICENNLYAMGVALNLSDPVTDLVKKADAYDVEAAVVDGMDVLAVEAATQKAVDYIRSGNGPYFLECRTYRFRAHSMFDAELYRDKEEVQKWRARDPIPTFMQRLLNQGLITEADVAALEEKVAAEIETAVAFAEAGTWEPVEDLARFVYSEGGTS
ncbi:MAG: pyruvate dehydrogenase (acetyl-transferring) E1 component subunit alpha [Chloroflexi bacterium]|nr:pyruvate dehydrogenase (acetyl-transferring) E1 component subunit alpha [Chloroflexota bacterium]